MGTRGHGEFRASMASVSATAVPVTRAVISLTARLAFEQRQQSSACRAGFHCHERNPNLLGKVAYVVQTRVCRPVNSLKKDCFLAYTTTVQLYCTAVPVSPIFPSLITVLLFSQSEHVPLIKSYPTTRDRTLSPPVRRLRFSYFGYKPPAIVLNSLYGTNGAYNDHLAKGARLVVAVPLH